jgi:putative ABC transport system ATP-binding protein
MVYDTRGLIAIHHVSKKYRRGSETITALKDVSLTVNKGELLAIVGPSGSGKTTLAQVIGGLTRPSTGTVEIRGEKLAGRSDRALSRYRNQEVGFVFQNFSLVPHYTVLENVVIPLVIANIPPNQRRETAARILELVGLGAKMHRRADTLSGGERQRVSIARALANQPSIIIADEPTGSLDSARGNEIMTVLEKLAHDHDTTVLMVTHDEVLARRADRVIHIYDGEIAKEQIHARA